VRWCRGDVLMVDAAQNKHPQTIHRVIPGSDPGSSLLIMSTNYTNYHELKEQDKDMHPAKNTSTKSQNNPHNINPRQSAPFICENPREPHDPGAFGVAKSVCHRDRRSLPDRQLRCLCRTDFGSPGVAAPPLERKTKSYSSFTRRNWMPCP